LSVTWLSESFINQNLFPESCTVYRADRGYDSIHIGGGALIAISLTVMGVKCRSNLKVHEECVWITISISGIFSLLPGNHYFSLKTMVHTLNNYFSFFYKIRYAPLNFVSLGLGTSISLVLKGIVVYHPLIAIIMAHCKEGCSTPLFSFHHVVLFPPGQALFYWLPCLARLRRQSQITRDTALKAQVNRLQRSVTYRLNKWRNEQWSDTLESLDSEDQSLWKMTKKMMRVPTPSPPLQVPG
jgi:hypothetical protein